MKWLPLAILLALGTVPSISVSPDSGEPAIEFVVTGSGFEPGERVKVLWDGANLGGTSKVDGDGRFSYSATVPGSATPGTHTIEAQAVGGGVSKAQASFAVTTGSTSTSSTVTSTTSPSTTSPSTTPTTSPTLTSTTLTGTVSPTTQSQAAGATPPDKSEPTASTNATGSGSTLTDSEPGMTSVSEPLLGTGDSSSVAAADSRAGDTRAGSSQDGEDVQVGSSQDGEDARGSGGLILVLAVIGLAAAATYLIWGRSKRNEEEQDADLASLSGDVAPLPPLSAADVNMDEGGWVREMMDMTPRGEITTLADGPGGLLAVGPVSAGSGDGETSVWMSDEGIVWKSVARLAVFGAAVVVPWKGGMLMTISHEEGGQVRAACWSSDDGHVWERLTGEGPAASLVGVSLEGATAFGEVVVAWGRDSEAPGVWFSTDGANWQRSALQGGFDLIDSTGDGLMAFGRDLRDRRTLITRSADGISWEELDRQSRMVFEGASVAALTTFQGGLVAGGIDVTKGSGAVWVSDDGSRWHRIPFEPEVGTSIDHLSVVGDRLLAVGTDAGRARGGRGTPIMWETSDVISWSQVPVPTEIFSDTVVNSVLLSDESILACGTLSSDRNGVQPESIPVSWRWRPERIQHSTDEPVQGDIELVAAGSGGRP